MTWHPPLNATATTLLVLGALVAMALSYLWSRKQMDVTSPAGATAAGLRLASFLLLIFFLLQPTELPAPQTITTQRSFAVLVDKSGSMSLPSQDVAGAPTRLAVVEKWLRDSGAMKTIGDAAKLSVYGFDGRASAIDAANLESLAADGKMTGLGAAIEQVAKFHQHDDLAGMLIFSDGRNTSGGDPREAAKKAGVPIYTVAVGAALPKKLKKEVRKDLALESVTAEPRIIVGRTVQVVVNAGATGYGSRQVTIELLENDRPIGTTTVAAGPQQTRRTALFSVKPTTLGVHRYQVRVPLEKDEADPTNNLKTFEVEVVDPVNRLFYIDRLRSERKFLEPILAGRRHLRYASVVQLDPEHVLSQGNDADLKRQITKLDPAKLTGIKAVILGDLPASTLSEEQIAGLATWVDKGGSLLLLAGPTSLGAKGFGQTPLAELLPVKLGGEAHYIEKEFKVDLTREGAAHPAFQKTRDRWAGAAPLLSRFDVEGVKPASTVLMASTDAVHAPVVVSRSYGHGKVAVVLTDSTWRWQLAYNPAVSKVEGMSPHAAFWNQIIDWMLPDLDQTEKAANQVQLISDRLEYEVNDQVLLMVNVRGSDGGVVRDASVEIAVATPDGRPILRTARLGEGTGDNYTATFQAYAEGRYTAQAVAKRGGQTLGTDQVQIKVTQPMIEFTQTDPDAKLLSEVAEASGGRLLEAEALKEIGEIADFKPRKILVQPNADTDSEPAWNKSWLAVAFIGMMSAEWIIRRRNRWV